MRDNGDVDVLLGDTKKAILAMAVPIMIAMIAQTANNLIDSVWVSGLGSDALAVVGLVFPLFFIMISIGQGIGVGSAAAISRRIGRGDKEGADRAATQAIGLTIALGIAIGVILLVFSRTILIALGAGDTIDLCMQYAIPVFACAPIFLLNGVMMNLLRSEGAAKRSMNTQILAAVINAVLDPIFIYTMGWGMAGAAIATALAVFISLLIIIYWYFVEKKTYLSPNMHGFRFDKQLDFDIFRVGIPACLEMVFMSIMSMVLNTILISVDGTDGVAIYSATWRLMQIAMIPLFGLSGAIVPVVAAAFGMRRQDRIREAYVYSLKLAVVMMIVIGLMMAITAPYLVGVFTYSDSTLYLKDDMTEALRVFCLILPFMGWGFVSGGIFQGLGMGTKALISTLIRNGLQIPFAYQAAVSVSSLLSVWLAITVAEIIGSVLMGVWSLLIVIAIVKGVKSLDADVIR